MKYVSYFSRSFSLHLLNGVLCVLLLQGCNSKSNSVEAESENSVAPQTAQVTDDSPFQTITWLDLIPEDDLTQLMNPPDYVLELEDGSELDTIESELANTAPIDENDPYQRALTSTRVIEQMNGKSIRIPGFVVPLEFTEGKLVKDFFLVPYFGACIHEPPPPPNQIILVSSAKGIVQDTLYQPYWISGILTTKVVKNEMAKAAYVLELSEYELYTEENAMPEAEF